MLRYTIQLAAVEFLDDDHYKIRPVVVLTEPAGDYHTVLAAPIIFTANHRHVAVRYGDYSS